jgi:hypothetical protein
MEIHINDAIIKMRQLTEMSVPFSIEFYSYNSTKKVSDGYKKVESCLLRQGLRKDNSDKSEILIAYYDYNKNKNGFFNLPLLMKLNGYTITR